MINVIHEVGVREKRKGDCKQGRHCIALVALSDRYKRVE